MEEVCLFSPHQDDETVIGELHMNRDGGEHRQDQTAKHQGEPVNEQTKANTNH